MFTSVSLLDFDGIRKAPALLVVTAVRNNAFGSFTEENRKFGLTWRSFTTLLCR